VSYHAVRLTKSAKLVEDEQWTQVDVYQPTQHVVDLLIQSAVNDPLECRIPPPPATDGSDGHMNGNGHDSRDGNGDGNGGAAPSKLLSIENTTYFVVKATAETLGLLGDYLSVVINLELVVTDVMSRIIEFLKVGKDTA
jgi:vacuolar protein sorting-associated protein 54